MAFRDLCKACGARLGPHLEALTHLFQSVQNAGAMATAATATVDEDDVQQVSLWPPLKYVRHCCPRHLGGELAAPEFNCHCST